MAVVGGVTVGYVSGSLIVAGVAFWGFLWVLEAGLRRTRTA